MVSSQHGGMHTRTAGLRGHGFRRETVAIQRGKPWQYNGALIPAPCDTSFGGMAKAGIGGERVWLTSRSSWLTYCWTRSWADILASVVGC